MPLLPFLKKENVSLLINISGGSINTSLVLFNKNQIPKFLYAVNTPFVGEKQDIALFSEGMTSLLDSTLKDTIKKGWSNFDNNNRKKISHVVLSFSSPWCVLKTKEINLSKDNPFIITKAFIDSVVLKEEAMFKTELLKDHSETMKDGFDVIEKSIVHAKINGYAVSDILNKKTKSLDAFVSMSAVPQNIKEKISSIVLKHTHIPKENIMMHSFPLVLFSTIRDNFDSGADFILINIGSEMTDISLINDNTIKSVASFPFGKNTIIRHISKSFKISEEIAESQLVMYLSEKVNDTVFTSIQSLILDLEKEWAVYFEDALLALSKNTIWPMKTFVLVDKETSPIFINFLKLYKADATSNFRKNAEITEVEESIISHLYNNDFKMQINEPLAILTIFYNKFIQSE